jgi:hypothetical protein
MAEHFISNQTVRNNLQAAYEAENWPLAYTILLNYMNVTSDPIFTPELKFWFQGAIEINSDAGTPTSEFIRTYTQTSFELLGEPLSDTQLQQISDGIARAAATVPSLRRHFARTPRHSPLRTLVEPSRTG